MIENLDAILSGLLAGDYPAIMRFRTLLDRPQKVETKEVTKIVHCVKSEAAKDNSYALWALALMHDEEFGLAKDETKSIALLERAMQIEANNAAAMVTRANFYIEAKNLGKAKELAERACKLGYAQAAGLLGYCYEVNENPNIEKAIECYKLGAQLRCGWSAYNLGRIFSAGKFYPDYKDYEDYEAARYWYEKSLELDGLAAGDAANNIGILYRNGCLSNGILTCP